MTIQTSLPIIAAEIPRLAAEPIEVEIQERRRQANLLAHLLHLLSDLLLIARAFISPIIDGLTDRDYARQTAAHNTAMAMDCIYDQVVAAYFFVHQPRHWRGEPYHPGAVEMFRRMTKEQAQEYLRVWDRQHEAAVRQVMNEIGVSNGT